MTDTLKTLYNVLSSLKYASAALELGGRDCVFNDNIEALEELICKMEMDAQ